MQPDPDLVKASKWPARVDRIVSALYGDIFAATVGMVAYYANTLVAYGFGLFAVLPFLSGIPIGMALRRKRGEMLGPADLFMASLWAIAIPAVLLMLMESEGMICILMAFPIGYVTTLLGALLGGSLPIGPRGSRVSVSLLALSPLLLVYEAHQSIEPSLNAVTTTIIVNAPPERIWPYLVNLDPIQSTDNYLFKAGVAHPLSTHTNGGGVGAARFCELSTGEMPERISVWQPGQLLVFDMLSTPACMKELNPFGPVHSGHLFHYFEWHEGRFQLIPLGSMKTEIVGTSTFDHHLGPSWYWSLWTIYIVHRVHSSVLEEIKRKAETPLSPEPSHL